MERVSYQGSGVAEGGEVVQFTGGNSGCFYISPCPLTSSGTCAQVGVTIAVDYYDQKVIPLRATVNIDTVGVRKALDRGGDIKGYKIDVYGGVGRAVCRAFGRKHLAVDFLSY
jgi:3D (Asp-Asp-Asp) domain-containing protein